MKKFLYNKWTKVSAAVMCVLCVFAASLTAADFITGNADPGLRRAVWDKYAVEDEIYNAVMAIHMADHDSKTLQSSALNRRLDDHFYYYIEYPVYSQSNRTEGIKSLGSGSTSANNNAGAGTNMSGRVSPESESLPEVSEEQSTLDEPLTDAADALGAQVEKEQSERRVASNTEMSNSEEFIGKYQYYFVADDSTVAMSDYVRADVFTDNLCAAGYKIYIAAKPEYIDDIIRIRKSFAQYMVAVLILLAAALVLFIYLLAVCGRTADGSLRARLIDRVYIEFDIAILLIDIVLAYAFLLNMYYDFTGDGVLWYGSIRYVLFAALGLPFAIIASIFIAFSEAIVRNIKCGTFARRSIIIRFAKFLARCLRKMSRLCASKAGAVLIAAFVLYSVLVGAATAANFIIGILVIIAGGVILARLMSDVVKIKNGIFEIRDGNLKHKIEGVSGAAGVVAEAVNNIGEGLSRSVDEQLRAERMKVELITNVSHDLKTPLTSIISYADLLSDMELSPSEANDYVEIIRQKGERLKNLTGDLFDISKVQSGNEIIERERLDLSLLIKQTLGETAGQTEDSGLEFISELSDDAFVLADGKKMSRVFENLLNNILKYSMKGTRVYISCGSDEKYVTAELKNISEYPLDFDDEEITGRFVRGDKSRSTEGNGLGLAIAKSYTEACGGRFEIKTDGDLFKAIIRFPKNTD